MSLNGAATPIKSVSIVTLHEGWVSQMFCPIFCHVRLLLVRPSLGDREIICPWCVSSLLTFCQCKKSLAFRRYIWWMKSYITWSYFLIIFSTSQKIDSEGNLTPSILLLYHSKKWFCRQLHAIFFAAFCPFNGDKVYRIYLYCGT